MTERKTFYIAILFIIFAKVFWIFGPTYAMGIPRLGDDSLVYLWTGASSVAHSQLDSTAIQDIVRVRNLNDAPNHETDFSRARVTMRVASVIASPYALITGELLKSQLDLKYVFAIMEFIIFLLLLVSLLFFGLKAYGYGPFSIALIVLSLAFFPNQGMHYFVPSVMVMSLSLVINSLIIRKQSAFFVFVLSLVILLTHTIAQIYLLLVLLFIAITLLKERGFSRENVYYLVAMTFGVVAWQLIAYVSGVTYAKTTGMGEVDIENYLTNFYGFIQLMIGFTLNQPLIAAIVLYGACNTRSLICSHRLLLLTYLIGVFVSFLINIPGYPADLTSRIFVPITIFLVLSASVHLWKQIVLRGVGWAKWFSVIFLLVFIVQYNHFIKEFFANINQRSQIVYENVLSKVLDQLPSNASIIWMDTDTQFMYSLLVGKSFLHAIPYKSVSHSEYIKEIFKTDNLYVAAEYPERLNGISALRGQYDFTRRFYGFDLKHYKTIVIENTDRSIPELMYLKIENLQYLTVKDDQGAACKLTPSLNQSDWFSVSGCSKTHILITSASQKGVLTGVQIGVLNQNQSWPWGSASVNLTVYPRNDGFDFATLNFGWEVILGADMMKDISFSPNYVLRVVNDLSGVVLIKID